MNRLALLMGLLILAPLSLPVIAQTPGESAADFGFGNVSAMAHDLAQKPFQPPPQIPEFLRSLTYDQWRDIRFRPREALWRQDHVPFNIQFFHPGFLYNYAVTIHAIEDGKVQPVPFRSALFDYGKTGLQGKIPQDIGFAGFRIHYPLNRSSYKDEVAVFLGASYFRAVAKGEGYGLSARGIAENTALSSGEDFPMFKEFWIQKPHWRDKDITVFALLDGKDLTGAYRFRIRPGSQTIFHINARLFLRQPIARLGIAPLTGMFFYGQNQGDKRKEDFRPEVHDCDGLSLALNHHEWVWRPLVNPDRLLVNVFQAKQLQGFGLMQRDENFDHYLDLESHFERRPSTWVRPNGDWGPGSVYLVQIPSPNELNDNIVAFWVPQRTIASQQPYDLSYTLTWGSARTLFPPLGYVTYTHSMHEGSDSMRFVIEFNGHGISSLGPDTKLNAAISAPEGYSVEDSVIQKNELTQGWRLVFRIRFPARPTVAQILPEKKEAVELRAALQKNGRDVTETWSYAFDQ